MSSSMLEQAVIDAQALKEAAIKNAEQEVLEKYSGEIKEAVNALLEQDIDPLADPLADPMAGAIEPESDLSDTIASSLPLKALDETKFSEDSEEVEIDLDALREALEGDTAPQPVYEATVADLEGLLSEDSKPDYIDIDKDGDKEESMKQAAADKEGMDEEIEMDEETLKATIAELLNVDIENVPRGNIGTTHPTQPEQVHAVEVAAARDEDQDHAEENAEFEKAVKKIVKLEEQVKSLKSSKNRLIKDHNELKSIARQVSDKLTELNTTNAKLVYQNRILESHSLNERQKEKLVEAVSNANSTEEAKVIFETLQDSLSSKAHAAPKNLSEAVSKNSRLILKSNKKQSQVSDSATNRMKKLAGII
jgi:hypothetical protein